MTSQPAGACIVHDLPQAPEFLGRESELSELTRIWTEGFEGVVAMVGLGGSGKTALAARFLASLRSSDAALPSPDGVFVWSFYREPDAGQFLLRAFDHFRVPSPANAGATGLGLVHLLAEALANGNRHLLVLDGLERVQSAGDRNADDFGRLEDPLLKTLLLRAAAGVGRTLIVVTSRFPLADLEPAVGLGYRRLAVGGLDPAAAVRLLRRCGVVGDDDTLRRLAERYGDHALTLDHLGGLIGQFLGGDPARAPELPAAEAQPAAGKTAQPAAGKTARPAAGKTARPAAGKTAPGADRQALRLTRLLRSYEEHLPPAEHELLLRLCLFRRTLDEPRFVGLLVCSPPVHMHTARELFEAVPRCARPEAYEEHVWLQSVAELVRDAVETAILAAPLAGPEATFHAEAIDVLHAALRSQKLELLTEAAEIARLYAGRDDVAPSDERPLSIADREQLHELLTRYVKLQRNPLLPPGMRNKAFLRKLEDLGYLAIRDRRRETDLMPGDVLKAIRRVSQKISALLATHRVLRRLREVCVRYQQKWRRAGPLATLDAAALRGLIASLVRRHLVLRHADGALEIHPAVRDHFRRRAAADSAAWHDAIREQLLSLSRRPGTGLTEDPATLDLVEEAIHHALEAGREDEAIGLYEQVLGGHRHLAWKLGEIARGLRIVRMFAKCPSRSATAWYLRSVGELDEAYRQHGMAYFKADIRLLQGRLPEAAGEGDPHRKAVAAFLMGETTRVPDMELGCPLPLGQLHLYRGRPDAAVQTSQLSDLYAGFGWEGDRARLQLVLADAELQHGQMPLVSRLFEARRWIDEATAWITHSGSMEHLAALHLTRARAARAERDRAAQARAIDDGLHVASQCGFELFRIELLCERAMLWLAEERPELAEAQAREALTRTTAEDCRFVWGALEARYLLAEALAAQRRFEEARTVLAELREKHELGHPRAVDVQRLLEIMPE